MPRTHCHPMNSETSLTSSHEPDEELLERLCQDDESAWREFNDRFANVIYGCIHRVLCRFVATDQEDAREIYATLCVQLLSNDKRKLKSFEAGRGMRLSSWLGLLATHATYDYLRRVRREPHRTTLTEAEQLGSSLPGPHESCLMRQRARLVADLLAELTPRDRQFVQLYYAEGLEPQLVAERLGISVKTVYSKKHKVQARLEQALAAQSVAA